MTHTPFINISNRRIHGIRAVFLLLALFALTPLLSAGGHPVTKLSTKFHSIVSTAKGDYISASITNGGLGSYYSYWIEVPEGLTRLEISIFDPDTGGAHDIQDGTGWNTKTSFLLYNPASDPQTGDLLDVGENPSYDGIWFNSWGVIQNPMAGHWELRVDTAGLNGDDCNAFGVKAEGWTLTSAVAHSWNLDTNPSGWTKDPDTSDNEWAFGTPVDGGNGDPSSGHTGNNVYGYDNTEDGLYATSMGEMCLTTGAIDCSSLQNTRLRFWRWLGVEEWDDAKIQVSTDGSTFNIVEWFFDIFDTSWTQITVDISEYADDQQSVYLRWVMGPTDIEGQSDPNSYGWNIDDIEIIHGEEIPVELNVYADSFVNYGFAGSGDDSQSFTVYPYVDCGCAGRSNEFDSDSSASYALTSPSGGYKWSATGVSGDDNWQSGAVPAWTTDFFSDDYGIWSETLTVTIPSGDTSNFVTHYLGDHGAAPPPPTAQPQAGALRLYLPTSAGAAPVKPYVGQAVRFISGQNPPLVGQATRLGIRVDVTNPTPHAITFSASNTVDAYVPGGDVVYAGTATVSQGSIIAYPTATPGPYGWLQWNPGVVAANTTASLYYHVDVTPTAAGRLVITGTAPAFSLHHSWDLSTDPVWATGGQWAWGTPTGGGGASGNPDPNSGHTGSDVYGYNLSGDYSNSMPSADYLTTKAIDCSGLSNVQLRFWRWLNVEGSANDHAVIEVSNDNTAWTKVYENPADTAVTDAAWTQVTYDISAVADNQSTVYIRWAMGPTNDSATYSGWNIDDIELWGSADGNGTTATYVDETGNTTQGRATFTFGPLCELAVTTGTDLPTRALISDFGSEWAGGQPVLRWSTAAEQGTVGFHVSRWDEADGQWRRLTEAPLPALPGHPQGGVYRLPDRDAVPGQTYQYRIEELDVHGRTLDYGPFTVTIPEPASNTDDVAASSIDASGTRTPHPRQRRDSATLNEDSRQLRSSIADKASTGGPRPEAAKVAVRADGLHAVSFDALAEALALPRAAVEALAHRGRLEITSGGRLVTYLTDLVPGAIVLYGRRLDSPYADANVYRVAVGRGRLMTRADGAPPAAVAPGLTFATTQDAEEDHLPAPAVTRNPESDYWFWDYLFADHPTLGAKTFTVPTPAPAGTGDAALAVRLHGGTETAAGPDHQVTVRLNGALIGTARWDGLTAQSLRFTVDPAILRDGANTVELTAHLNEGIPYSLVYVDGFAVDYVRQARADNDRLRLAPGGMASHVVAVDGFTRDDIVVLDITDPDAPVLQPATVERAGRNWRAFFRCQPRHDYFAASVGTAAAVTAASPDWPSRLRETDPGADYVVIAPRALSAPAGQLAAYRAAQGHRTVVVDIDDIYDEFNHGRSSPHAIRDFLAYAAANWRVPPRFVVLAGRGTYDYRDLGGFGDNLLPPLYLGTSHGLSAADNRFACVAGDDNVPDLAIGRLPAATAAELQAMVDKIVAYEAQPDGAWSRRALVVADNPDPAGDFPADSETVAAELPPWLRLRRISLAEQTAVEARDALVGGIATGAGLVNYLGHGGVDRLAAEGVLRLEDIPLLANGDRLPLVLAFTCAAGECTIPGYPGLGEALLTRPAGGAIAVYAPAGLSDNAAAVELNAALAAELGRGHATLGEALRAALAAWAPADPTAAYHRDLYILLGDPALRLAK